MKETISFRDALVEACGNEKLVTEYNRVYGKKLFVCGNVDDLPAFALWFIHEVWNKA